jgi:hypothetical protein
MNVASECREFQDFEAAPARLVERKPEPALLSAGKHPNR